MPPIPTEGLEKRDRNNPAADSLRALGLPPASGWPVERTVSLLAGGVSLGTLLLGRRNPRWRLLTGAVSANLILQGAVGWCPASAVMYKLGMRTAAECVVADPGSAGPPGVEFARNG